ncbi:MAG: hypothetical protein M3003_04855 [Candidatus Dormibacteraeota bacterium]|nr:hypothetical protein [Candidatus Dormibacteraeota bacterium]
MIHTSPIVQVVERHGPWTTYALACGCLYSAREELQNGELVHSTATHIGRTP